MQLESIRKLNEEAIKLKSIMGKKFIVRDFRVIEVRKNNMANEEHD